MSTEAITELAAVCVATAVTTTIVPSAGPLKKQTPTGWHVCLFSSNGTSCKPRCRKAPAGGCVSEGGPRHFRAQGLAGHDMCPSDGCILQDRQVPAAPSAPTKAPPAPHTPPASPAFPASPASPASSASSSPAFVVDVNVDDQEIRR
ncbi:hypothetical protein Landi51_13001 [Colletotrichum acutatum]